MNTSDQIDLIAPEWVAALNELGAVTKDRVAKIKSDKGSFSYTYADINDILSTAKPVFAGHGLAISQSSVATEPGNVQIVTRVMHTSGQWLEDDGLRMAAPQEPRQIGTALTYARRYALVALLALETPDDDGGEATEQIEREIDEANELDRRIAQVVAEIKRLDDDGKAAMSDWKGDRSLSGKALHDPDWLARVEAFLDEYGGAVSGPIKETNQ